MTSLVGRSAALAGSGSWRQRVLWQSTVLLATTALVIALTQLRPADAGLLVLLGSVGGVLTVLGLACPAAAVLMLLVALFFRLPLSGILPADPFLPAFAGVVAAAAVAAARRSAPARFGGVELAMALYVLWNIGSAVAPHQYPATIPSTGEPYVVWRLILTGTVIPFVLYVVGRHLLCTEKAIRGLLVLVTTFTAYSVAVSHLQIVGPQALVWPRYILATEWRDRAVGIFNQPVVNGLVLVIGFVTALLLGSRSGSRSGRVLAGAIAIGAAYSIYLTHTRAAWLAFALVVVMGSVLAAGFRALFAAAAAVMCLAIAINWSTFTSSDRAEGGVASVGELEDRLNIAATSLWAVDQRPLLGWGIGRFDAVNTYHHRQWSWDVPWERGWGLSSHVNELGIAAEVGLIGLALWLSVLVLVGRRLVHCFRTVTRPGVAGSGLVFLAGASLLALVVAGVSVDLRFFDFPNALVMTLAGIAAGLADRSAVEVC